MPFNEANLRKNLSNFRKKIRVKDIKIVSEVKLFVTFDYEVHISWLTQALIIEINNSSRYARNHKSNIINAAAAAAAKSLQSCPTLCGPIDGSPPCSPVPGILQARILEWVAISSSNA